VFCAVLTSTWAEPDPKKYKSEVKEKSTPTTAATLTDDERQFLREVESKFGIKSEVPIENIKIEKDEKTNATSPVKAPFPAVIAIEIVNDTDSSTKGKRTIDANLGYGYRTNNGYTYTYFGKQPQEKGKFMIYPYSQEDIPPARGAYMHSYRNHKTKVEIQPSQAYELIDENEGKMPSGKITYDNIKGLVSPPTIPQSAHPTFYTTYNGQEFSALSGQFPSVMPNYLVESSQLLKNAEYQNAGINQEYIQNHGNQLNQRVVPVLVLRVPSSYLKKPTAELYSNSYPVSHYLNNVNLQELVNDYFKKIGYSFAPQIMDYQPSVPSVPQAQHAPETTETAAPGYEPQNYAAPYVNPSYSNADYSGVQYSSVQPVMAKYPTSYNSQQYFIPQSMYQQPAQQYQYSYQYTPQSGDQTQSYYVQSQYQTQEQEAPAKEVVTVEEMQAVTNTQGHAEYGVPKQQVIEDSPAPMVEYGAPETQNTATQPEQQVQYETAQAVGQEYDLAKVQNMEFTKEATSSEYGTPRESYGAPKEAYGPPTQSYGSPKDYTLHTSVQPLPISMYGQQTENIPKDTLALLQPYMASQSYPKYIINAMKTGMQNYYFQKQLNEDAANTLVLSENFPSKDHTLATVLPVSYTREKQPVSASGQGVSYVTPAPHKYQSQYRIMVPQTIFKNPSTEKVMYVNSHSLPVSQYLSQEYNPEMEYTLPAQHIPPVASQKAPSFPRNYHSRKRNVKNDKKAERTTGRKKLPSPTDTKKKITITSSK
jgi:hypothetical protein